MYWCWLHISHFCTCWRYTHEKILVKPRFQNKLRFHNYCKLIVLKALVAFYSQCIIKLYFMISCNDGICNNPTESSSNQILNNRLDWNWTATSTAKYHCKTIGHGTIVTGGNDMQCLNQVSNWRINQLGGKGGSGKVVESASAFWCMGWWRQHETIHILALQLQYISWEDILFPTLFKNPLLVMPWTQRWHSSPAFNTFICQYDWAELVSTERFEAQTLQ